MTISESPATEPSLFRRFDSHGFLILSSVLDETECDCFANELTESFIRHQGSTKRKIGGVRNLLRQNPRVTELANSARFTSLTDELIGRKTFPVRAIFFDKTADANWRVPWHQDLAIAVAERIDTSGFGSWSIKEGIPHAQPPRKILEGMVALRLHLDDCRAENGALRVIPGSHQHGELDSATIANFTREDSAFVCEAGKGSVLALRPLLLHASSSATTPSHRRVLHIEYASDELPDGLRWFDR